MNSQCCETQTSISFSEKLQTNCRMRKCCSRREEKNKGRKTIKITRGKNQSFLDLPLDRHSLCRQRVVEGRRTSDKDHERNGRTTTSNRLVNHTTRWTICKEGRVTERAKESLIVTKGDYQILWSFKHIHAGMKVLVRERRKEIAKKGFADTDCLKKLSRQRTAGD